MKKIVAAFLLCMASACIKKTTDNRAACPVLTDNVSWDTHPYTYGKGWSQPLYRNWKTNDGISDSGEIHLVSSCIWKIYGNETGGYGHTYAAYLAPDTALIFRWAFNMLTQFVLSDKWQGETSKGIRMGDTRAKFLSAYPNFKMNNSNHLLYEFITTTPSSAVRAYFSNETPTGKLKRLKISTLYND